MTRRFLHSAPWSSLLDAWSEACPRLRHTINVRDDRSPSKQAARRAPSTAPKLARLAWKAPGARYPIYETHHPSSTILPRDLPDSSSAWARLRLAALMVPKVWSSVVRSTPLSMRSATSLSSMCWPIMSGVWNEERVNIDSQWIEIALPLKTLTLNSGGGSIKPNFPWGAIRSAIVL